MARKESLESRNEKFPLLIYPLEQSEYSDILQSYREKAQELITPETTGTMKEYSGMALLEACESAKMGWGVGAVSWAFDAGRELIVKGRNMVFETNDPKDHAEVNLMDTQSLLIYAVTSDTTLSPEQNKLIYERTIEREIQNPTYLKTRFSIDNVDNFTAMEMITTMQPCDMCTKTVGRFESGFPWKFSTIWIAAKDKKHGDMRGNFKFLSEIKKSDDPRHVPPAYLQLASDIYLLSHSKVGEQKRKILRNTETKAGDVFTYRRNLQLPDR